jgi:hypothetical protein
MNTRNAGWLLFFSLILGGCASYSSQDAGVKAALQEREDAYIRLAKAITAYCSVSTETLDARHACIVERRLSLLQFQKDRQILPMGPT